MMKRIFTTIILIIAIALIWPLLGAFFAKPDTGSDHVARLAVQESGRVKPYDSVARSSLLLLRGKQTLRMEDQTLSASEWLADVMFDRNRARDYPVFRVDHPDILGLFGIEPGTQKYFSYREIYPYLSRIQEQARNAPSESSERNSYESGIIRLFNNLVYYQQITQTVYPLSVNKEVRSFFEHYLGEVRKSGASGSESGARQRFSRQIGDMSQSPIHMLLDGGKWYTVGEYLDKIVPKQAEYPPQIEALINMAESRQAGDADGFREAVINFQQNSSADQTAVELEYAYNQGQPFIVSLQLYVLIILLVFLGWQFSPGLFLRTAYWILLAAIAIHTIGIILRVVITGYAPVTNLYSSAVFVGWVAVVLSAIFEKVQKQGIGSLAAAVIGFLTLLVAHHLADSGDTMEKMRAVLNSNFWLSTHVITITMGYGATFLAGFLGIIYLLYGWMRRGMDTSLMETFHRMIYGAVCFALLFNFVGTVLGGIWADQSWGRFWGWDPKENGALMIVLWTALVLHALRAQMIGTRGLVHLCIVGNIITAWSWFGTNMLGVGLHAYGFMDSAFFWLVLFWGSQILIMGLEWLFPISVKSSYT